MRSCVCCGREQFQNLPSLNQGVLSDGRIWAQPLERQTCSDCGYTRHVKALQAQDIQNFYNDDYQLSAQTNSYDKARAEYYWSLIQEELPYKANENLKFLEVGCGNGALLHHIEHQFPQAALYGIEPAKQAYDQAIDGKADIRHGFFDAELFSDISEGFDFIFSVNVIEHILDPLEFLKQKALLLQEKGFIAILCPDGSIPNTEILFYDHVSSFTKQSMMALSKKAGLDLVSYKQTPQEKGRFHLFIFSNQRQGTAQNTILSTIENKEPYLKTWQNLDENLMGQYGQNNIVLFGGGEMAFLLRAFVPTFWQSIDHIVYDNAEPGTFFEKTVRPFDPSESQGGTILFVAARPSTACIIERRLKELNLKTDSIHNYIKD